MKNIQSKNSRGNVKKIGKQASNSKGKELIKRKDIKDTPFTVITTMGVSFVVMGKYKITEDYATTEEAEEDATRITWNRIIQVIMLLEETKELLTNKII